MLTYEQASDKVIIALDCSRERAFELADMLAGKATWVKVGMTLFYAEGPAIVEAMRERGLRVFLDLKVHDIPFQVQGAVRSAAMTGADIISIHSNLETSRHLFGADELRRMKSSAYLINVSRGGIIDEAALAEALNVGEIAGAGIDVTEKEPLPADSPLRGAKNILLTPHMAWYSEEASSDLKTKTAKEAARYLTGVPLCNQLNKF